MGTLQVGRKGAQEAVTRWKWEMMEPDITKPVVQEKEMNLQATKLKNLFAPREEKGEVLLPCMRHSLDSY